MVHPLSGQHPPDVTRIEGALLGRWRSVLAEFGRSESVNTVVKSDAIDSKAKAYGFVTLCTFDALRYFAGYLGVTL